MITVIDSKLLKNKIFSVNKTFITIPFFNILLNIYIDLYTEEDKNYPTEIICLRAQRHLLTKKKKKAVNSSKC